ncbi:MAG TPA: diguanylate cyclase [Candidatus Acidoferrales bacterium]|jgi:diguanylate cyclase (GGDEF)-like protein|nr:diguanylate cyclase [Candidatus Acidoferrales bacterium]
MRPLREILRLDEVTALFEQPESATELGRAFCDLLLARLPISLCALVLGPRHAARIVVAVTATESLTPSGAALADSPELDAIYRGTPVEVNDGESWPSGLPYGPWHDELPTRGAALFLPVLVAGQTAGFLCLEGADDDFEDDEIADLRSFVRVFALALSNAQMSVEIARLSERTSIDAMTGVLNRRAFDERLRVEWRRATRDGSSLAIALLDVDQFRMYYDTYGRERGDNALRQVAQAIAGTNLRPGDFVARYGAEEFAIVMPDSDEAGALALCDRVRLTIAERALRHERSMHGIITVSIGVAATRPDPDRAPPALLYEADSALYRAKQAGRNRVAGERAIHTSPLGIARSLLPPLTLGFIGRSREADELVRENNRFATIVGAAGIGKTALALELAHRTVERAVFVDLSHVERGDAVAPKIASALGIEHVSHERTVSALRDRTRHDRLLLVLDRCEHVLSGVAQFALAMLDIAGVRILATSREPLHVEGERVYRLGPLANEDALAFFERYARETNRDIAFDQADRDIAQRLVARLDAVPLAIEVAARALRNYTLAELEANFDHVNSRDATSAVEAALASSYLLLSAEEKRVFARLSVFPQDGSLEAARGICGDRSGDILRRLADKSLASIDGDGRVRMLASTRAFAAARLRGLGEHDDTARAHARFFINLLPDESLSASPERLGIIRGERANFDAALSRAMSAGEYEIAGELVARLNVTYLRLIDEDAVRRFIEMGRRIGESAAPRELRLRVLAVAAYAAYAIGDLPLMRRLVDDLLSRAPGITDPYTLYAITAMKYIAKIALGDAPALLADADAVIEVAERTQSARLCATTLFNLATWGAEAGTDLDAAERWALRGIEYARRGAPEMERDLTLARATIAWRKGDEAAAAEAFGGVLRAVHAGSQPHLTDLVSIKAAGFELWRGNVDAALALLLDALRAIRRAPQKRPTVGAIDAYVHAACRREKFDVALRLHSFVTAYRRESGLRRSPFAEANYAAVIARCGLPADPPAPDIADADQAFALALTI